MALEGMLMKLSYQEAELGSRKELSNKQGNGTVDLRGPSLMENGPDSKSEDKRLDQSFMQG